jgi:hypothetical protein
MSEKCCIAHGRRVHKILFNPLTKKNYTILLTWSQGRCIKCQRFLGLHQHKYCTNCSIKRKAAISKKAYIFKKHNYTL